MTAGELLSSTMVTSGAITHRLNRLVTKGLVDREPDPKDRRSVIVSLTPHGRAIVDRALPDHVENERRMLEVLAPDERGELARLLQKLLVGLGDAREEPAEATLTFTATIPPYRWQALPLLASFHTTASPSGCQVTAAARDNLGWHPSPPAAFVAEEINRRNAALRV